MEELMCAGTFPNRGDAEVAKSLLESEKIESLIEAVDEGSMRPHLAVGADVHLMVHRKDFDRATQLLTKAKSSGMPCETEHPLRGKGPEGTSPKKQKGIRRNLKGLRAGFHYKSPWSIHERRK